MVAELAKMKNGNSIGPDNIPIEACKALYEEDIQAFMSILNDILLSQKVPQIWSKSAITPVLQYKGSSQD